MSLARVGVSELVVVVVVRAESGEGRARSEAQPTSYIRLVQST